MTEAMNVSQESLAQPKNEESRVLEAAKLRAEIQVHEVEAELKRLEAQQLRSKPRWLELSVPGAAVVVAIIGFLGSFIASYIKGWSDLELTRRKYDSDLVLKAVTTDPKQSRENLKFLLEAGLLKDADGRLAKAVADPSLSIRLPSPIGVDIQDELSQDQMRQVLMDIQKAMNVQLSVEMRKVNDPGISTSAAVAKLNYGFTLFYSQEFVDSIRRSTRTNWSVYSVVAHELAHVALGHFSNLSLDNERRRQAELDADAWSGTALAKLGATLVEGLAAFQALPSSEHKGGFFPTSAERLAAVEKGWRSASGRAQE